LVVAIVYTSDEPPIIIEVQVLPELVERSHFTVGVGEPVASASKLALCPSRTAVLDGLLVTTGGAPAALIASGDPWLLELVRGAAAAVPEMASMSSIAAASSALSIARGRRQAASPSGCALSREP
jgi:hypothetical protein